MATSGESDPLDLVPHVLQDLQDKLQGSIDMDKSLASRMNGWKPPLIGRSKMTEINSQVDRGLPKDAFRTWFNHAYSNYTTEYLEDFCKCLRRESEEEARPKLLQVANLIQKEIDRLVALRERSMVPQGSSICDSLSPPVGQQQQQQLQQQQQCSTTHQSGGKTDGPRTQPSAVDEQRAQPSAVDEQRAQLSAVDGQRTQPSAVDGQRTQPSAVDGQRAQLSAVDGPRTQALREAHETLKSFYTEPIKLKKPGKVNQFVNLSLIERPPHLYRKKKDVQEFLEATACGIDQYSRKAKNFPYDTILTCTMSDSGKRVVIVGPPGSGKTSLAHKLCRDLYSGHLPNQYQLVLFAELKAFRVYLKQVNKEPSLVTLLEYSGLPRADNLFSMVEEEAGRNVAIILDGFDEISDDKPLSSWVFQLFSRNIQYQRMRKQCDMFITTRPSQLVQLTEAAEFLVEVLGFLSSDIEHYIKAYFVDAPDRAEEVIHRLHSLPLVHGLCSNPRVLEITCTVFEHLDEEPLPDNLSGIFLRYLLYQLETDLVLRDPLNQRRIRDLLSVPQDLFPGFYTLCRLAYQCCLDQQLLLEEEELGEVKKYVDKRRSVYNLLFAEPVRSPSPIPCVLYQSEHKTVTEALAAVHIAVLPPAKQQQIWEEQFTVPHMAQVWMMYCGLTDLKFVDLRRLSSLSVSERGREVVNGVKEWALKDEDMLLMVSLHEANNSEESKRVLPAVLKNTITAIIKSHYDAMVVGNAITHHTNLQTVDLDLDKGLSEIDLQSLNAKNVKSVSLAGVFNVAQIQAVLPQDVEEVAFAGAQHSYKGLVDALRAYQCLHSLDLIVRSERNLGSIFDSLSSRLTCFKLSLLSLTDALDVSVESLRNVLVPREKCSLLHLPLYTHQLSAVLTGLRRADKLKELNLYIRSVNSKVSPNQCFISFDEVKGLVATHPQLGKVHVNTREELNDLLFPAAKGALKNKNITHLGLGKYLVSPNQWFISCDEVEELVATHPQLVKVDVGCEKGHNNMLLAVAKGALKNKNITHLGLGKYLSRAVLPLLRSPSADHITSVRARVDFSTRPGHDPPLIDDGEWCDLLLGGAMATPTCHLTLREVTTASLGALLSRVHTVPKLADLSITIEPPLRNDDQTLVDVPGVEAAFRVCQLKKLRIFHSMSGGFPQVYPLCGAVLCGIAANSTAQVDTCIYGWRSDLDVDKLTGQLSQQTLERFEVVKTRDWSFIISRDAACPSASRSAPITPSPPTTTTPEDTSSGLDPSSKPQPMATGPVLPPEHPATPVSFQELLKKYRDRIYADVVSTAVAARLEMEEVISAEVAREVKDKGDKKGNCLVYLHLLNQGDFQSLRTFSIVLKEEAGNPKMQKLGEELLVELDQLLPAPSSSLPS